MQRSQASVVILQTCSFGLAHCNANNRDQCFLTFGGALAQKRVNFVTKLLLISENIILVLSSHLIISLAASFIAL